MITKVITDDGVVVEVPERLMSSSKILASIVEDLGIQQIPIPYSSKSIRILCDFFSGVVQDSHENSDVVHIMMELIQLTKYLMLDEHVSITNSIMAELMMNKTPQDMAEIFGIPYVADENSIVHNGEQNDNSSANCDDDDSDEGD